MKKLMKAEKDAIKARTEELVKEGIDKDLAKVMARAEFDCGLYRPVVYYNS